MTREKFLRRVQVAGPDGCWLIDGFKDKWGYGYVKPNGRNGKRVLAHRYSYELHHGPIPEGYEVDHLCFKPACVNPAHLEAVTKQENMRRAPSATKTHCVNGHPYDEKNTYRRRDGRRACRACGRERARRRTLSPAIGTGS